MSKTGFSLDTTRGMEDENKRCILEGYPEIPVFFASNQGRRHMEGVEPDYIIYRFTELREAIAFFKRR